MKRIFTLISIVAIFGMLLSACGGGANTHLGKIKAAGTIKIGTSADYPPFESVDASGNKTGFDIDLMTEIAKRMGVKLEWVDMPFDSLIAGVQEGKIDGAISAFNFSEERDKVVDFTDPYYTGEDAYTVADSFTGTLAKPEDAAAYKVGVQTGTTQDAWITDTLVKTGKMPEANLFKYDRADQVAMDLKNGRIDVMLSDAIPAEAIAKQLGGLKIAYKATFSSGPMNIVIPQDDKELAQAFNDILKQLKSEGFIDQLATKYFSAK